MAITYLLAPSRRDSTLLNLHQSHTTEKVLNCAEIVKKRCWKLWRKYRYCDQICDGNSSVKIWLVTNSIVTIRHKNLWGKIATESCSVRKILRRKNLDFDGNCDEHFDGKACHNFEGKLPEMRFFGIVTAYCDEVRHKFGRTVVTISP